MMVSWGLKLSTQRLKDLVNPSILCIISNVSIVLEKLISIEGLANSYSLRTFCSQDILVYMSPQFHQRKILIIERTFLWKNESTFSINSWIMFHQVFWQALQKCKYLCVHKPNVKILWITWANRPQTWSCHFTKRLSKFHLMILTRDKSQNIMEKSMIL
jgi:hypothetical protein